ncbi:MAG: cell division protein ZapA [Burkholderiaceae bacterium]|jgi:cell division protein ZapA|nr:cell division protein ZapA [Burkholderiaceae bacterium]
MIQVEVTIMGQSFKLACQEEEERSLREAVMYLDDKMCAIRDAGKVLGNDRIAIMASIYIAAELLSMKAPRGPLSDLTLSEVKQKITGMHETLDKALAPQETLF